MATRTDYKKLYETVSVRGSIKWKVDNQKLTNEQNILLDDKTLMIAMRKSIF